MYHLDLGQFTSNPTTKAHALYKYSYVDLKDYYYAFHNETPNHLPHAETRVALHITTPKSEPTKRKRNVSDHTSPK